MLQSNAEFLVQLAQLFASRAETKGSVFVTQKRFTYEPAVVAPSAGEEDAVMGEASGSGSTPAGVVVGGDDLTKQYPCLIRATDGQDKKSKVKLSTLVQSSDYEAFTLDYGRLLKNSLTSLKKKKKVKVVKKKGDSLSVGLSLPKVVGPRRGAGVKVRRRSVKNREKALKVLWARKRKDVEAKSI